METEKGPEYPAKINRPIFRNILKRERLFSLLDEPGEEPLVWVSGPAGCGKTTFLSTYVEYKKIPCIWYQMDESDRDPGTFFHYLELTLLKMKGKKISLPRFTPCQSLDIKTFSQSYLEKYFQKVPRNLLVVFDSFPAEPPQYVMDMLLSGLSRLPRGIRIMIISRALPPPATSNLRLKGRLRTIGGEDMRLDPEEFKSAAGLHWGDKINADVVEILHGTLEGWYAGLALMAEVFRTIKIDPEIFRTSRIDFGNLRKRERLGIYEYFGSEIWDRTDDELKDFFLRTSFLSKMTVSSASALTGFPRAGKVLADICKRNLFISTSGHDPMTYQYHSLFRDFLRDQAEGAFTPDQIRAMKGKAARILEHGAQYEDAASLLIEIHGWEDLSKLVVKRAPEMLSTGRHRLLARWVEALPESERERDQEVLFTHGLCLLPLDPAGSRALFIKAMDLAMEKGDAETAFRSWTRAVESVVYESSNFQDMVPLLGKRETIEKMFGGYASLTVEAEAATGMVTALLLGGSNFSDLGNWTEKALSLQRQMGESERYIHTCILAILKHHYMGETLEMEHVAQTLMASFARLEPGSPLETLVCYAGALSAWATGDFERSLDLVTKGLEAVGTTNVGTWEMQLLAQGFLSACGSLDGERAEKYLAAMKEKLGSACRNDQAQYYYIRGFADFLEGDYNLALGHAEKAYELKREVGNWIYIARASLALAQVNCALGQKEMTEIHLDVSRKIAGETGSTLLVFLCDLTGAGIALASGEREKAASLLKSAFEAGVNKNILLFCWYDRITLANLMAFALEQGIHPDYAQKLIHAHQLTTLEQVPELEMWPWPVKIYSLGRFEILVDGEKIEFHRKTQEKPLALLKAILAFGGRQVADGKLMEALWPDSDGSAAHQALATTLHRLRQLIGVEGFITYHQGMVTLNPQVCWVDVWGVERALGRISPHLEDKRLVEEKCTEVSPQVRKSLELYKGHFLNSNGHEPWTLAPRERLRSKYIRSVKNFCSHLEAVGDHKEAIHWYCKTLELDHLAEELWQGLIRCYMKTGRKTEALATYSRCRRTFSTCLGVEPSEETERLRRRITDAEPR